jgi:zinc transport system ATP-binding protein
LQVKQEALSTSDLSVHYPGRIALDSVSLSIQSSSVVAILGANGSGKSTFVKACLDLTPVQSGSVKIFGQDFSKFKQRERVGYVPQRIHDSLGIPATVHEVVESGRLSCGWLRKFNAIDKEKIAHAIDIVGLADRTHDSINALSSGQFQRALIARALASEPDLLFLDEPTAGVDLATQTVFANALQHLVEGGTTVVLVSHDLGPLRPLISRAIMFRDGRVVFDGSPSAEEVDRHIFHDHPHARQNLADGWPL